MRPVPPVRRPWLALALCIAIGPAASAQTAAAVDAISAALRAGDFTQAVERSQAALVKTPNDVRLWTLNGLAQSTGWSACVKAMSEVPPKGRRGQVMGADGQGRVVRHGAGSSVFDGSGRGTARCAARPDHSISTSVASSARSPS